MKLQADFRVRPIRSQLSWYPRHGSIRDDPLIFGGKIISVLIFEESRRVLKIRVKICEFLSGCWVKEVRSGDVRLSYTAGCVIR